MTDVKVSVSVMAHRSRADMVDRLVARLGVGPDAVLWDSTGVEWDTGRRAWQAHDPAADWHLVVQDDAIVCDRLLEQLPSALAHVPDRAIVSLYVGTRRPAAHTVDRAVRLADEAGAAWIVMPTLNWGVAVAAPVRSIPAMLATGDGLGVRQYDRRVGHHYWTVMGWPVWCTWPTLVDHTDGPSLWGNPRGRRSHRFIGEDATPDSVDWSAGSVDMPGMDRMRQRTEARRRQLERAKLSHLSEEDVPMGRDPFRPASARRVHVIPPAAVPVAEVVEGDGSGEALPEVDEAAYPPGAIAVEAVPARPRDGDRKAVWVDYAVAHGAPRADAAASTKAALIETYG